VAAPLELGETELGQANDREQQKLDRALDVVIGEPNRRAPRWPAAVVDQDVDAAEGGDSSLDEPFEVGRVRDVPSHRERAEPFRLTIEQIAPASKHGHVRAFAGERLRCREPHAGGCAADNRGPAF